MAPIFLGLIGLATLVVLVAAFLASKYWHWAHVLVMVLLYFTSVAYLVLMVREQGVRHKYQQAEAKSLEQLERQTAINDALKHGTKNATLLNRLRNEVTIPEDADQTGGIRELEHQVRMLNRRRGRIWRNARPIDVDRTNGQVRVGFPIAAPVQSTDGEVIEEQSAAPAAPAPLAMQPGAVVYVFGEGEPARNGQGPGQYIGEFRVNEVEGREALLEPLGHLVLDVYAAERLINHQGPWIVYESMPADNADLFASFSEEELRALLPAASVEEYLRDGTPSQDDDDPARLEGLDADGVPVKPGETPVKFRYRRQQRDYALLFQDLEIEHAELVSLIQATSGDLKKLEASIESAERMLAFREEEVQKLRSDLTQLQRDRKEIESYAKRLKQQIVKAEQLLDQVLSENAQLVAELTKAQGDLTPVASGALDIDAL